MESGKQTSFNIRKCNRAFSEKHNQRLIPVPDAREDLLCKNDSRVLESIAECYNSGKRLWEETTGRKLQKRYNPIKEGVLVTKEDTTMAELERFGQLCYETFGIRPIQYYLHNDEGHYDRKTGNWISNYHAHIVFDYVQSEHRIIQRYDPKIGGFKEIDIYGKFAHLSYNDYQKFQDLAAEALGMERGIRSDRVHLSAIQYKYAKTQENYLEAKKDLEETNAMIKDRKAELDLISNNSNLSFVMMKNILERTRQDLISSYSHALENIPAKEFPKEENTLEKLKAMRILDAQGYSGYYFDSLIDELDKAKSGYRLLQEKLSARMSTLKAELQVYEKEASSMRYIPERLGLSPGMRKLENQNRDLQEEIKSKDSEICRLKTSNETLQKTLSENNLNHKNNDHLYKELNKYRDRCAKLEVGRDYQQDLLVSVTAMILKKLPREQIDCLNMAGLKSTVGEKIWEKALEKNKTQAMEMTI